MKSCTDVNQSEKLAEILPVESADMMWDDWSLIDEGWKLIAGYYPEIEKDYGRKCYPAWSLAALLDILPKGTRLLKSATGDTYHCDCPKGNIDKWYDNPVDACIEMIFALKKRNLL